MRGPMSNRPSWIEACPYYLFSRELDFVGKVYVCICLMQAELSGVGATRDEAFESMNEAVKAAYPVEAA